MRRSLTVTSLRARQILDSRGNPTVEVDCVLSDGSMGRAAVPSGVSAGVHEALELRDGNAAIYGGKSVLKAVANVHGPITKVLRGTSVESQREIDALLVAADGTPNKSALGANAIVAVSMAICRARALADGISLWHSLRDQYASRQEVVLPVPLMNVINGGKHADSGLSFQECMIIPVGFDSFSDALRAGTETFHVLKGILASKKQVTAVGDEGGFAPHLRTSEEAFSLLLEAVAKAGYEGRIKLGIDAAASEFYSDGAYTVDGQTFSSRDLVSYYQHLAERYPLLSIEDSHAEDDWEGFVELHANVPALQLVGDDLLVTSTARIEEAIKRKAVNAALIKLNQVGTVTETVDAIQLAQEHGWGVIVSHRSGETEDTFIAHLAVGIGAGQIKTGSLSRTDRVAKYNELLRIEEELAEKATYAKPFGEMRSAKS